MTAFLEFSLLKCFIILMFNIKKILTNLPKVSTWCLDDRKYYAVFQLYRKYAGISIKDRTNRKSIISHQISLLVVLRSLKFEVQKHKGTEIIDQLGVYKQAVIMPCFFGHPPNVWLFAHSALDIRLVALLVNTLFSKLILVFVFVQKSVQE